MATTATIRCPRCRVEMSAPEEVGATAFPCPICAAEVSVATFPRLRGRFPSTNRTTPELPDSGDAVCRFFPELKAEKVCEECGSFLSEKASVIWNATTYCMPCLHKLRNEKNDAAFSAERRIYDNLALSLVTWGLPVSLFTAPIALFILIRHRKDSRGIVPRGPGRWWFALVLSIVLTLFWGTLMVFWVGSLFPNF